MQNVSKENEIHVCWNGQGFGQVCPFEAEPMVCMFKCVIKESLEVWQIYDCRRPRRARFYPGYRISTEPTPKIKHRSPLREIFHLRHPPCMLSVARCDAREEI